MSRSFHRIAAALFTATALAAGAAHAGSEVVEVTAGPLRAVYPGEADAVQGWYRMSDGRQMHVVKRGASLSVRLDGEPVTRVLAQSAGTLRDPEGRMTLVFDTTSDPEERSVTVTLTRPDGQKLALASARVR